MGKNLTNTKKVRPPIVVVLGHVDHGKTTLLDTIRNSHVAAKEHGGITQHIGAYQVTVPSKDKKTTHTITFLDTPGHEAFAKIRSRGATAADIALLVVAADDSVKPQTIESIKQIQLARIPMIVVANKIDMPGANIEKLRHDLAKNGVQVEGFGGDVPMVQVSAKLGTHIPELLDMIVLLAEMKELVSETDAILDAVVLETRLDQGKGMVATVLAKQGTLLPGLSLFDGNRHVAKIRAMFDEYGDVVPVAPPAKPVLILGFTTMPVIGSILHDRETEEAPKEDLKKKIDSIPDFLKPIADEKKLTILLKTDTAGSMEAIIEALGERIDFAGMSIGEIGEADILQAKASKAVIIGFNVSCKPNVAKLAQTEKVVFRTYKIIYELLDELTEVILGMKEVLSEERELGTGTIIAEFPFNKVKIAGIHIKTGRLARGDSIKLIRDGQELIKAKIKSIRQGKNEVTKVEAGNECGVLFDREVDFLTKDDIIAYIIG